MSENPSPSTNLEKNQPSIRQWAIIAGIALLALCGITLFIVSAFQFYFGWEAGRKARATQAIQAATAVMDEGNRVIQKAARWPTLLFDSFIDNTADWIEGEVDDEYATMTMTLDGRYTWEAEAKQGFVWRVWPDSEMVSDFYLAVDAQNLSDNLDAQYGLIFRSNDEDYYYLEVRDSQYFRVFLSRDSTWIELVPSTYLAAIQPGGVNHLEVAAIDDMFYFAINGQFAGQTEGSSPSEGQVGVIIGLTEAGEKVVIAFDNLELRAPESSK